LTAALRIGLTGGIGSGKSTVAAMFADLGATVVDSDAIARTLTAPGGAAIDEIRRSFGEAFVGEDGGLDRPRMRAAAFTDPLVRQRLEALLHPLIGAEAQRQARMAPAGIVFDVPLLAESHHWRSRCDRILVVDCEEATQVERVARRPGWNAETARAVIAQQATRARRRAIADAVIHNDGMALALLREAVAAIWLGWGGSTAHAGRSQRAL
jgi:dephospho-CoA kinase